MARRKKGEHYTFTVEGGGDFPFDMLRYDACWPYSEGYDSTALAVGSGRVVLQSTKESGPTPARWASFGWRVIGMGEQRESPSEFTMSPAEIKKETMRIHDAEGVIPAVKFYRAALYRNGKGTDPGLKASCDLIRDVWSKE